LLEKRQGRRMKRFLGALSASVSKKKRAKLKTHYPEIRPERVTHRQTPNLFDVSDSKKGVTLKRKPKVSDWTAQALETRENRSPSALWS